MTKGIRIVMALAGTLLATGCGGSNETAADPMPSDTPTSAEPTPVEAHACRSAMGSADSIAAELETVVIYEASQFNQMLDRLNALQETADGACTIRVLAPLGKAMTSLARASAGYTTCSFVEMCDESGIQADLIEGTGLIHEASEVANRTG